MSETLEAEAVVPEGVTPGDTHIWVGHTDDGRPIAASGYVPARDKDGTIVHPKPTGKTCPVDAAVVQHPDGENEDAPATKKRSKKS